MHCSLSTKKSATWLTKQGNPQMEHPNSVTISNIWCSHPSNLHEPLSFSATHETTTTKSCPTTRLDKNIQKIIPHHVLPSPVKNWANVRRLISPSPPYTYPQELFTIEHQSPSTPKIACHPLSRQSLPFPCTSPYLFTLQSVVEKK